MPETKKPEEFVELKADKVAEGVKSHELHPGRLRRFVSHLSLAAIKAEDRSAKKQQIKEKIDRIRSVSLNKRSTKQMIEGELGDFESVIHEIIHDEEKILEEQRRETQQISELKRLVENLSKKLIDIGREYAQELEEKDSKIMELREALAAANIKISESGEERKKKIHEIERRIRQRPSVRPEPEPEPVPTPKITPVLESADDIAKHLKTLEQKHEELKASGMHSKEDLDRVKMLIEKHKVAIGLAPVPEKPKVVAVPKPQARPKPKVTVAKAKPKAKPKVRQKAKAKPKAKAKKK